MGTVYKKVLEFKEKYPFTIGWRLDKNSSVVEKHLNPDEEVLYAFIAQKNDSPFNIWGSAVVALTNKRILIGRKRVVIGYFLNSITPDLFNDLKVSSGILWGKVYIDTVKEFVTLSNISKDALTEIETEITSYMMREKQKYGLRDEERD
ncbi:MAG: hypothetical protein HFE81_07290 [Bacilli bacterium]|mgnify:CR=1 FL=1|nr:hypothetical protein [Bacilli bacterium]